MSSMDDFSGLEYEQESVAEEDVISKTNNLLSQFNLPTQVTSVNDITAALFVVLYESLFSDRLPGIVRQPLTIEDEISNCQTVIDVLSADVIMDNLSHIRGVDIVEGKVQAINNLLDIFTFLFEYVIKNIESDAPTDTDDDVQSFEKLEAAAAVQDAEVLEPGVGDIQHRMKNGSNSNSHGEPHMDLDGGLKSGGEEGKEKGAAQKPPAVSAPSPIPPNASTSLMGQKTLDSTADLIHEGEQLDRQFQKEQIHAAAKTAWDKPATDQEPRQFDFIGVRPVPSTSAASMTSSANGTSIPATTTASYYSQAQQDDFSATEPLPSQYRRPRSPVQMRATVAEVPPRSRQSPERSIRRDPDMKGLASSIENLHQMVQKIAAYSREAVDTSPLRHQGRAAQLSVTDLSPDREPFPLTDGSALARELNHGGLAMDEVHKMSYGEPVMTNNSGTHGDCVPTHPEKKSSLKDGLSARHMDSRTITSTTPYIPPNTDYVRPSASSRVKGGCRPPYKSQSERHQSSQRLQNGGARHKENKVKVSSDKEVERVEAKLQLAVERMHDLYKTPGTALNKAKEMHERQAQLSTRLEEMGKPTLASAQRILETEKKLFQHRQDCMAKLYHEEFGDAVDEVNTLLAAERKLLKAKEEECKRLKALEQTVPKKSKPPTKPKGYLIPKTKRSKTKVSRVKKRHSSSSLVGASKSLTVCEDEDIVPKLLEEFPHLDLADHSWHEMRRKTITQIENLSRAYEENQRRKSKAQLQLEEAARKYELMADIARKEMEHTRRMQQMTEQKRQKAAMANKLHEKRSQSVRTRRYYDEYQVRARAKMLKQRTKEELIFKNLVKDGLEIQKERIQDVRRYAKEQREKEAKRRQDEIDSMENFYRNQFEELMNKLLSERHTMAFREKCHQKMLEQMKRDIRNKMEKEIQEIHSEIFRDDDYVAIRQLEADRLRHKLQHARYQTRI